MSVQVIPDIEKVVSNHIRNLVDVRVVGKTPKDTEDAWVRVTQLDARQLNTADHLIEFLLQLDVYAGKDGGQPEASLLTRNVRAALGDIHEASHQDAVVNGASIVGSARIPDQDFEPARERFALNVTVWAHS